MRIFRVEDARRLGPWGNPAAVFEMNKALTGQRYISYHERFPTPWEEGLDFDPGYSKVAVKSLWWLRRWFPKAARKVLADRGFQLATYEVPDDRVQVGRTQLAFDPADATLIDRVALA